MGRVCTYKPEYAEQARKLCLLGFINTQLEEFFGVSHPTLLSWRKKYPEFADAIKAGKSLADGEVVSTLYNNATGGDTTACIFWLKNRQPEYWKDRKDVNANHTVRPEDIGKAMDEALSALEGVKGSTA